MKTIIIGDVHGMLTELEKLLKHVGYQEEDRVICVGDLVDKGPNSVETVRYFRDRKFECVLGNHEDWYVRYGKHEGKRLFQSGYVNPMKKNPVKIDTFERLTTDDLLWMMKLPTFMRLGEGWLVVHGGILPNTPVEKMETSKLIRLRWLDKTTKHFVPLVGDLSQPENTALWPEFYNGHENVVFGHQPFEKVSVLKKPEEKCGHTYALDTGCVYGGALSCLIFFTQDITRSTEPDITWVKSERAYAARMDED